MRTTITLIAEAEALVRRAMTQRGLSFKEVVNAAIMDALAPAPEAERYVLPVIDMGDSYVDDVKALQESARLEDERTLRLAGIEP